MSVSMHSMTELTTRAEHALIRELGVVDAMRFLSQFRDGKGDYTAARDDMFKGETVKSIAAGIKARRDNEA